MEAILKASTELRICLAMMDSSIMCMPTMIRVLYATGIRINEMLSLKDEGLNIEDQYLIVKDSKNGKERVIPISNLWPAFVNNIDVIEISSLYPKRLYIFLLALMVRNVEMVRLLHGSKNV